MKKWFALSLICCLTLFSGIFLTACGGIKTIEVKMVETEMPLYDIKLSVEGEDLIADPNGKFLVDDGVKLRVDIAAKSYGVDFSGLTIKIGKTEKEIVKDVTYSIHPEDNKLHYGYFLVSKVNSNMTISISGVKGVESKFTFEGVNLEDEDVIARLKNTSIDITLPQENVEQQPTEPPVEELPEQTVEQEPAAEEEEEVSPYINLYDFLTGDGDKSYTRKYDVEQSNSNPYFTFKLKFGGVDPYEFTENDFPFKIKKVGGVEQNIAGLNFDYNTKSFYVNLGKLDGAAEYIIVVDFSRLRNKQFIIAKPTQNSTYNVELDKEVIDFETEATLTLTKHLEESGKADYSNMEVFLNYEKLEMIEGSNVGNVVKYKIPSGITPASTNGFNLYQVRVTGIEYTVEQYSIYANSAEYNGTNFIVPEITAIDEEGNDIGPIGFGANGEQISLAGQRNAVFWEYRYDEDNGGYISAYDLYDYDIDNNGTVILNVKEVIGDRTVSFEKTLENGYKFKATYNKERQAFDKFALEFVCSGNTHITFSNYKPYEKNIDVSYSFEDERVLSVEFAVMSLDGQMATEWASLTKNVAQRISVSGKQVVAFRITSERQVIKAEEFKLSNNIACDQRLAGENSEDGLTKYCVAKFVVSSLQYADSMEVKLILAGTILE